MALSLLGLIPSVLKSAKGIAKIFLGDKEKRDQYAAQENQAGRAQYAAEFHQRANRTWWDSFVDGMNRLMRPSAFFTFLGMFLYSMIDPEGATLAWIALSHVPDIIIGIFSIMIGFLFSFREWKHIKKWTSNLKNMDVDKALETARKIKELRQDLCAEKQEHDTSAMPNATITKWKEGRG